MVNNMVKQFVRVSGDVNISHMEQEVDGLSFRVQFKHAGGIIMLIDGTVESIDKYVAAHGCTKIDKAGIKALYDETFPNKTLSCEACGGTGNRTISEYDVDKAETDLKANQM